ncbi:MAG: amidohydrolase family protein, partial [Deltaproteobacteria bacterium]|nr:amidohydrolase family protein [Deltaproteobacteria bacterium]
GNVDITVGGRKPTRRMRVGIAIRQLLSAQVSAEQITLSSDAHGTMPVFDEKGSLVRMGVGDIGNLLKEFHRLVAEDGFPVSDILQCITLNPAKRIKIDGYKGSLEEGKDADLIVFDSDWRIDRVYSMGKLMVSGGKPMVKGGFE